MNRIRQAIGMLGVALVLAVLLPGVAGAEEATCAIQVDGAGKGEVVMALTLLPGDSVRVELTAASGTGYSWQLAGEPKLVAVDKSGPQPVRSEPGPVGAPYREVYVLRAGETAGDETIRFILARPWESKMPAKTLTIAVTVRQQPAGE